MVVGWFCFFGVVVFLGFGGFEVFILTDFLVIGALAVGPLRYLIRQII